MFPVLLNHICDTAFLLRSLGFRDGGTVAAVSVETVVRVMSSNHYDMPRVDIFVYWHDGAITRYHPGHRPSGNAKPHTMPRGTCLIRPGLLAQLGAGNALHLMPPGLVALQYAGGGAPLAAPQGAGTGGASQPTVLFTRAQANLLHTYDVKMNGWNHARQFLQDRAIAEAPEQDLSDGDFYPWWLFLANTGKIAEVLTTGVYSFHVLQLPDACVLKQCFRVRTEANTFYIFRGSGIKEKIVIRTEKQMESQGYL